MILPNRSVSSTQTKRTVIMILPSSQWRCRKTALQAYVERIFSLCGRTQKQNEPESGDESFCETK